MSVKKYGWGIQKQKLLTQINQDSTFSHAYDNSKTFNITSKYFSFLTINHLQAESDIKQGIFLHVFSFNLICVTKKRNALQKFC